MARRIVSAAAAAAFAPPPPMHDDGQTTFSHSVPLPFVTNGFPRPSATQYTPHVFRPMAPVGRPCFSSGMS